ncbi:hypothetical protein AN8131.2 [Aspergillus nidulans FGSC A4]|uniref:FAD-binding domain-containing protein n=1 Tax=Emericella nidulans (strain FGSC A4 / ATCC 38163 / CBS 112.46 / NRRL 194 / M139) TaxID=227321 RepID=Q5AU99_EMENI|nr:hypothetical protein [Aspergillus nidulans FGSC A4]EAA58768.1 hypothetical protein AN8131.2 [Aspergillus nidulans FGSC A4]CBF73947.1 TPA: conserved hypothetical protein [Aspergillus nidulans FGSC A4]|eukprot:XP_681400.1 hypothetical protein AN8131.2 [Aspergillus nidulans FGSC A4]
MESRLGRVGELYCGKQLLKPMAATPDHKLSKVLIAGAGIAGLATMISLSRIAAILDLEIQLYEQAPELLEIGASIALSPNGMRTLEKLGVHDALSDDFVFKGPSGILQIVRSSQSTPTATFLTTRFHRGHLHAALLEHVPRQYIHLSKKLLHADADGNGVVLHFEDGTTVHGDILVGADGLNRALTEATPYTNLYPNFAGDASSTWVFKDRVTLVRDAAHAHEGAFAAVGPMALGDAFALWLAFRYILTRAGQPCSKGYIGIEGIKKALELYKRTRKPHTHHLLEIVHAQLNTKLVARGSEDEEDEEWINRMKGGPDTEWLSEHDVEKAFAHVVRQEDERVQALTVSRTLLFHYFWLAFHVKTLMQHSSPVENTALMR